MLGYAVDLIEEIAKQLREYLHISITKKSQNFDKHLCHLKH